MKVSVFLVKFHCLKTNEVKWLDQSLDFDLANRVCKLMARDGKKPVLVKVSIDPLVAVKNFTSKYRSYAA